MQPNIETFTSYLEPKLHACSTIYFLSFLRIWLKKKSQQHIPWVVSAFYYRKTSWVQKWILYLDGSQYLILRQTAALPSCAGMQHNAKPKQLPFLFTKMFLKKNLEFLLKEKPTCDKKANLYFYKL